MNQLPDGIKNLHRQILSEHAVGQNSICQSQVQQIEKKMKKGLSVMSIMRNTSTVRDKMDKQDCRKSDCMIFLRMYLVQTSGEYKSFLKK